MITINNKTVNGITIGNKEVSTITIGGDLVYTKFDGYFYIEPEGASTVTFAKIGSGTWTEGVNVDVIEYSTNKINWTSMSIKNGGTISVPSGSKLYIRNTSGCWSSQYWSVNITCDTYHNVGGNIMSLLNYTNTDMTLPQRCFCNLFKNNTKLRNAEDLILPDRTSQGCYAHMFYGASSLLTAPEISSPTATQNCYDHMFYCQLLDKIVCYYAGAVDTGAFNAWCDYVKSGGTFYNYGGGSFEQNSSSGIPSGWTVVTNP